MVTVIGSPSVETSNSPTGKTPLSVSVSIAAGSSQSRGLISGPSSNTEGAASSAAGYTDIRMIVLVTGVNAIFTSTPFKLILPTDFSFYIFLFGELRNDASGEILIPFSSPANIDV